MTFSRSDSSALPRPLSILYDDRSISLPELAQYNGLIHDILSGSLRYPQVKKLIGVQYQGGSVYRARTDKKNRLIFTYIPYEGEKRLLILGVSNHNYDQLKRHLTSGNSQHVLSLELKAEQNALVLPKMSTASEKITFLPIASYKQTTIVLDEDQQEARNQSTPLLLSGPPGAGKTVMLYHIMLRNLHNLKTASSASSANASPVLFISQSEHLVKTLRALYQTSPQHLEYPVEFMSWQALLQHYNPDLQPVRKETFTQWLKDQSIEGPGTVLHYELSLIKALGAQHYLSLGKRQCYYSGKEQQQKRLIEALEDWQAFLTKNQLFDPMVTTLSRDNTPTFAAGYCDEAQNLPPVALASLMNWIPNGYVVACLDTEQCLLSSPYIQNCLKELFHKHYGRYNEHPLTKTKRCRPEVIAVANHLIDAKYALDGSDKRRNYKAIESTRSKGGLVTWFNDKHFTNIKPYGALASTVVIAASLNDEERATINQTLGTNNILTPEEAIGLDFDNVILWNPFSLQTCLTTLLKKHASNELTLEQWNALNSIYVAITRAQENVFIFDSDYKRWKELAIHLLGELPVNQTQKPSIEYNLEKEQQSWWQQIDYHLTEGRIQTARNLMSFHLNLSQEEIDKKINAFKATQAQANSEQSTTTKTTTTSSGSAHNHIIQHTQKKGSRLENQSSTRSTADTTTTKALVTNPVFNRAKQTKKEKKHPTNLANEAKTHFNDKKLNYINNLLKDIPNFTANLLLLFNNSNFEQLLFDVPIIHTGQVLFSCILVSPEHAQLFLEFLKNNPDKLKQLATERLCKPLSMPNNALDNTSPLYWLCSIGTGLLLFSLLIQHSNLGKSISAEALCRPRSELAGDFANISPLYWLTGNPDGLKILEQLLAKNPELAKSISAEALCRPCSERAGAFANISPLCWLTGNTEGLKILEQLLASNPALAKSISGEALCRPRSKLAEDYANTSPLYWLTPTPEGRKILRQLLAINPELAKSISAEALCRPCSEQAGAFANMSPLYWLTGNLDGRKILKQLLANNPALAKSISAEALCRPCSELAEAYADISALYWLVGSTEGREILEQLLTNNPKLAKSISAEALCRPCSTLAGADANTSPLYYLSGSPDGQKILEQLLTNNTALAKSISAEALCRPRNQLSGADANTSPLYCLSGSPEGQKILKQLLANNPKLAKSISAEALCRPLGELAGDIAHTSPLYCLSGSPDGRKILEQLLANNTELAKSISAEALCRPRNEQAEAGANTSPLYCLSGSPNGRKILEQLLANNTELAKSLSAEALCRPLSELAGTFANTSPLYWLTGNPKGLKILEHLIASNSELAKSISAEALCRPRSELAGADANTSALYWLTVTPDGLKILKQLLSSSPQLTESIPNDSWLLKVEDCSPLSWLVQNNESGIIDLLPEVVKQANPLKINTHSPAVNSAAFFQTATSSESMLATKNLGSDVTPVLDQEGSKLL